MHTPGTEAPFQVEDVNMVEHWVRAKPRRWIGGMVAGAVAGLASMAVSALLSQLDGQALLMPIQAAAVPVLGGAATDTANSQALILGFVLREALCIFLGFVFAHFTFTNKLTSLLWMGLVWAAFAWVFLTNLYSPSWRQLFAIGISKSASLAVWTTYGLCLGLFLSFFVKGQNKN